MTVAAGPDEKASTAAATTAASSRRLTWPRVLTGLALAVVGIGSVFDLRSFTLIVLLIATGSLWELAKLVERKGPTLEFPIALAAVWAYIVLAALGLLHRTEGELLAATIIGTFAFGAFRSEGSYTLRCAVTLLGVFYIGKLLSYFIAIRSAPGIGIACTIYVILLIAFTDIGAMLVGTTLGRTPLTPISPRKTIEGAIGGLVIATGVGIAVALAPALHFAWWQGAIIGAVTSLAAQAGDLVESALKRDARVKDAGSAISGHGGVLDRFDSYLFGGIAFYWALRLTGHLPWNIS